MSEIDSSLIYRGLWIDWSRSRVLGATLTTNVTTGNLLIAVMTILVTMASGCLWNLVVFTIHQSRANKVKGSGLFQQQQVLLRTLPTPGATFSMMLKLVWSWRRAKRSKVVKDAIFVLLLSLIYTLLAVAASIFSSYAVSLSNNRVLTLSSNCATGDDFMTNDFSEIPRWYTQMGSSANIYARECYGKQDTPSRCNIYAQPQIPLTQKNAQCPLTSPALCSNLGKTGSAITIDSGLLDSNDMLGINAPPGERVLFRKLTTYFPLPIAGYLTLINASETARLDKANPSSLNTLLHAETWSFNYGLCGEPYGPNSTHHISTLKSNTSSFYKTEARVHYASPDITLDDQWEPIPDLMRDDADTNLIFIHSNFVVYPYTVSDPVFAVHKPVIYCNLNNTICEPDAKPGLNLTYYVADYPAGVIAATEQYQVCLQDSSSKVTDCSRLVGLPGRGFQSLLPKATPLQSATLDIIFIAAFEFNAVSPTTFGVGAELKVSETLYEGRQGRLPDNQWVLEAAGTEAAVWAGIQQFIATRSIGFDQSAQSSSIDPQPLPSNAAQAKLCQSQIVVKSGGVANTNVFALAFVAALCGTMIIIDEALFKVLVFMKRFRKALAPRVDRWIQDSVLQLQRRAYEAEGISSWQKLDKEVPVLVGDQDLPTLFNTGSRAGMPVHGSAAAAHVLPKPFANSIRPGSISSQATTVHSPVSVTSSGNVTPPASSTQAGNPSLANGTVR